MRAPIRLALMAGTAMLLTAMDVDAQVEARADEDSVKSVLAKRVLVATKAAELFVQTITASIPAQRMASPELPAAFWDTLVVRVQGRADSLVARLTPAFAETYTVDELRGLLAFYESPLGKRMIELQPTVMAKSMAIGEQWGMELGFDVAQEFMRAGLLKRDP